jgi:hypothetical protein
VADPLAGGQHGLAPTKFLFSRHAALATLHDPPRETVLVERRTIGGTGGQQPEDDRYLMDG